MAMPAWRLFTVDEYRRMGEAGIIADDERLVSVQSAIVLNQFGAPQHDLAVIRQRLYAAVPTVADVVLIIEVSDSSLGYDRGRKRRNYAGAGIVEYWIVNLVDRLIERYTAPDGDDYTEVVRALAGGSLASTVLPLTIAVDDVLPPGGN
jgi:Uma2 family endonuclease